jgi:ribosomal-protein-alanine N-acetyltransferase
LLDHIFSNLPTLETERLILRKLLYSDKKSIFSYAKNPIVAKHVLWNEHKSEFDTLEFLNIVYEAYNNNRAAPWGIQLKDSDGIIGTAGFVSFDEDKKKAEIGFVLSSEYWNQGLITEAVKRIIRFGFETMELKLIHSRCKPENSASCRVMEKCGFKFDGLMKSQMLIKGKAEDMKMYSLSEKAFSSIQAY